MMPLRLKRKNSLPFFSLDRKKSCFLLVRKGKFRAFHCRKFRVQMSNIIFEELFKRADQDASPDDPVCLLLFLSLLFV